MRDDPQRILPILVRAFGSDALQLLPEILNEFLESAARALRGQFFEREEWGEWDRASGWACPRKKAGIRHGMVKESLDLRARSRFFYGDVFEATIVALIRASGIRLKYTGADQIELSTRLGPGHPDGVLQWAPEDRELLSAKSMNTWDFRDFKKGKPLSDKWGYESQTTAYLDAALRQGYVTSPYERIVAIDKSTFELWERRDKLDDALLERRAAERERVKECSTPWELDPLPLEKGNKLCLTCRYCPIKKPCFEAQGYTLVPLGGTNWEARRT